MTWEKKIKGIPFYSWHLRRFKDDVKMRRDNKIKQSKNERIGKSRGRIN